jgi:hypothetical protein
MKTLTVKLASSLVRTVNIFPVGCTASGVKGWETGAE